MTTNPVPSITQAAGELREAARAFYNATVGDTTVIVRAPTADKRDAITRMADQLRAALISTISTTPSPISDQVALLHRLNDATKPVDAADRNLIIRSLSTAPTTGSAPEQRNLEGLREQILAPRGIERDADGWPVHTGARDSSGWLYHPAIPVCDEGTRVDKLLEAFGIETLFVSMESDASDFYDRWHEEGLSDCSSWVPTPPAGDGWLPLEIYDTEDGPCALFGRDWYEAEKVRKQAERAERRAALLAASIGGDQK